MKAILLITSGQGPLEARQFVAVLANRLAERANRSGLRVAARTVEGPDAAPRSVSLHLEGERLDALDAERGTHALLASSRTRSKRSRKRWFASVDLLPAIEVPSARTVLDEKALIVRACRAGGPGGQNVNRRETAVRIFDPTTGLSVRAHEHRTREQNHKTALDRMRAECQARLEATQREARSQLRMAQLRVMRGAPVRVYRLTPRSCLELADDCIDTAPVCEQEPPPPG